MPSIHLNTLQHKFPYAKPGWKEAHEVQLYGHGGYAYCVGGALLLFVNGLSAFDTRREIRFPSPVQLARCLRQCNPRLGLIRSVAAAIRITVTNDHWPHQPERAWQALADALSCPAGLQNDRVVYQGPAETITSPCPNSIPHFHFWDPKPA